MTELEVGIYALRTFDLHYARLGYGEPFLGPLARRAGNEKAWIDGTCTAECLRAEYGYSRREARNGAFLPAPHGHAAPHKACSCGIYGSLSLTSLYYQYPLEATRIVAVIAAEGVTIIGTRGLRTQYARVVAYHAPGYPGYLEGEAAREQFKDAQKYGHVSDMLASYGLPREGAPHRSGSYGPNYWR